MGVPVVTVQSQGGQNHNPEGYTATEHRFAHFGHYFVSVSRTNRFGDMASARLHVVVE